MDAGLKSCVKDQNLSILETDISSKTKECSDAGSKENSKITSTTDATETRAGSQSPEPNCSICLSALDNKSFTDSCFHMFCFTCLLEWSKVKAECPLCKQPFKSIIHNVRSDEDYDQYNVDDHRPQNNQEGRWWVDMVTHPFRYRTTFTLERLMEARYQEHRRQLWSLHLRPPSLSSSRINVAGRKHHVAATSDFRRRIYHNRLKVHKVNQSGHWTRQRSVRTITPQFFRNNQATTHRLVPWLNRELNALLDSNETHVQFLLELIMDLIKRYDILSEEFYEHIHPYIGSFARHFVREFFSFAESPYDMVTYDNRVMYEQDLDEDDEAEGLPAAYSPSHQHNLMNDNDLIVISSSPQLSYSLRSRSRHQPLHPPSIPFSSTLNMHNYSAPISTTTTSLQTDNRTRHQKNSSLPCNSERPAQYWWLNNSEHRRAERKSTPATVTVHDSDSSDDVIITKVEKPWRERSPIVLSSDSDDDRKLIGDKKPSTQLDMQFKKDSIHSPKSSYIEPKPAGSKPFQYRDKDPTRERRRKSHRRHRSISRSRRRYRSRSSSRNHSSREHSRSRRHRSSRHGNQDYNYSVVGTSHKNLCFTFRRNVNEDQGSYSSSYYPQYKPAYGHDSSLNSYNKDSTFRDRIAEKRSRRRFRKTSSASYYAKRRKQRVDFESVSSDSSSDDRNHQRKVPSTVIRVDKPQDRKPVCDNNETSSASRTLSPTYTLDHKSDNLQEKNMEDKLDSLNDSHSLDYLTDDYSVKDYIDLIGSPRADTELICPNSIGHESKSDDNLPGTSFKSNSVDFKTVDPGKVLVADPVPSTSRDFLYGISDVVDDVEEGCQTSPKVATKFKKHPSGHKKKPHSYKKSRSNFFDSE